MAVVSLPTKKADFETLIKKLWQADLLGGKTAAPSGDYFLNLDSHVLFESLGLIQNFQYDILISGKFH